MNPYNQVSKTVLTSDGTRIWISLYHPEKENGKLLVIAPAIGVSQAFYHFFACFFRQQGFVVIGFDYRGMGKSAPGNLKGYPATLHEWAVQDINAVLLFARQHYSRHELVYVGHCIGGEIIGLAPGSQYIHRMVLVSSALTCEKLWPWRQRVMLRLGKARNRLLGWLLGYLPSGAIGQPARLPRGVYNQMANWCDSANGLFDTYPDNNYRKIQAPVLVYTFTDDWLCPPRAVKELLNYFTNAAITWHHLHPRQLGIRRVGHIDFFYLPMKSVLWESLLQWLNEEKNSLLPVNRPSV